VNIINELRIVFLSRSPIGTGLPD